MDHRRVDTRLGRRVLTGASCRSETPGSPTGPVRCLSADGRVSSPARSPALLRGASAAQAPLLGQEAVGGQTILVPVGDAGDDQFVGVGEIA